MKGMRLLLLGCLAVLLIAAGCTTTQQTTADVGILYTKGTGPMPTLLATKQIDGYIAWQPFVEVAPVAHIGKVITYSGSFRLTSGGRTTRAACSRHGLTS